MSLGEWAISEGLFNFVRENLPDGSTILELGSGDGSVELAKHYTVYSVEHSKKWLNKYDTVNYIYAPIKEHKEVKKLIGKEWYDWSILGPQIKDLDYDLIIVDGPPIMHGRAGFAKYMIPQPRPVPVIFDDLHRKRDLGIALKASVYMREPLVIKDTWESKTWGYIWPGRGL